MNVTAVASERAERVSAGKAAASPLTALLPGGRLRPGTVASAGGDLPLLLALAAQAADGRPGWAAVGLPGLGALAAADAGLDLGSGLWVDTPGRQWPQVVATVLEAVPVVMVGELGPLPDRIRRRLTAVLRRSGSLLLAAGPWQGAEVRLQVTAAVWEGVGAGHGLLRGRRTRLMSSGRGAADRLRQAELWLPGPHGAAAAVDQATGNTADVMPALEDQSAGTNSARGRAALRVVG